MISNVRYNGRELKPHKSTTNASLSSRRVLTDRPWEFVALWLKRMGHKKALFYWHQARNFAEAAHGMPVESAPLLHYYSFMNAAKALLITRGVFFNEHHGVGAHKMRSPASKIVLSNEGVRLHKKGVAPALSQYLGETEIKTDHSLEELLFNLPSIHRTYCLTYKNQQDLFIPLMDCRFVFDSTSSIAYLSANLSADYAGGKFMRRLPPTFMEDASVNDGRAIRSLRSVNISGPEVTNTTDLDKLEDLHKDLRLDINYIAGTQTLWYVKTKVAGSQRLSRSPLTLTLLAMHRLSEICRYKPVQLASLLGGQKNWLITEFIRQSPRQFIDELSSELTGYQIMIPNVRPAA